MININSTIKYIELIGDRPNVELAFRNTLLNDQPIAENDITQNMFHPALWQQIHRILENEGVAKLEDDYLVVDKQCAREFYYSVDLLKAGRDHEWNSRHLRPLIFASPPQVIPKEMAADVDDISSLLTELVGSTKHNLILLSPYTTPTAILSILRPVFRIAESKKVHIKLFITNPLREAQRQIDNLEKLLPNNIFSSISFYYRSDLSQEEENILHAKVLIVDSRRGYLGSANFTDQGLSKHFELGVELADKQCVLVEKLLNELIRKKVFLPA